MKSRFVYILCVVIILVGFGCQRTQEPKVNSTEIDRNQILSEARKSGLIMDDKEIVRMNDSASLQKIDGTNPSNVSTYLKIDTTTWTSAALADVTGGGSFGLAFLNYQDGKTTVVAKMGNLTAREGESVYEGWLVQRGKEMRVVNLGAAIAVEDQFVVVFETQTDLSDHDFFVLTWDGQHILEGSFR